MGDHNGKVGIEQKIYILPQNMGKKELCVPRKLGTQSLFFPVLWQEIYFIPELSILLPGDKEKTGK